MTKRIQQLMTGRNLQILMLGTLCILGSFAIGIQSAGDVKPFTLIEAGSVQHNGDMNGNGQVDMNDLKIVLEVVQGYITPTPDMLLADPNKDGTLTIDDALWILNILTLNGTT